MAKYYYKDKDGREVGSETPAELIELCSYLGLTGQPQQVRNPIGGVSRISVQDGSPPSFDSENQAPKRCLHNRYDVRTKQCPDCKKTLSEIQDEWKNGENK